MKNENALPTTPKHSETTFKQWWHERGGKLPHDATKREVAILAWSAAMEAARSPVSETAERFGSWVEEVSPGKFRSVAPSAVVQTFAVSKLPDCMMGPSEPCEGYKALQASIAPSAIGTTCPENNLPCERECVGGWCQTMFGFPPEAKVGTADSGGAK